MSWRKFPISLTELCIDTTLRCGQSFRWKKSEDGSTYSCALHGRLISLRQDNTHVHYRAIYPKQSPPKKGNKRRKPSIPLTPDSRNGQATEEEGDDTGALLHHYLNLEPNLAELYGQWSRADKNFGQKAPRFTGVRILRQDAWEALVGFICSSNNNIARISQMMDKLCIHYGPLIGHVDAQPFYDLPPPSALTGPKVEGHLRELGFGYRARYLHQTALMISREDAGWLDGLRNPESPVFGTKASPAGDMLPGGRKGYREAHQQLLALQGVGPKVADCVCLMGLGWGEAVPVDTHVWQIAQRDYKFGRGKHSSLTRDTYDAVGNHFRQLWGKEAGWAHSVLFTADLRAFSDRLKTKIEAMGEQQVKIKVELAPALPPGDHGEDEKPIVQAEGIAEDPAPSPGQLEQQVKQELLSGDSELLPALGLKREPELEESPQGKGAKRASKRLRRR